MRIQILELPLDTAGEFSRTPFALIVDEIEQNIITTSDGNEVCRDLEVAAESLQQFGEQIGAVGTLCTAETIEVVN